MVTEKKIKNPYIYQKDNFTITTDPETFDLDVIHSYLTRSYWMPGVPKELVSQSIKYSFCFGLFDQAQQIGFTRVITDFTHFAYLCDVFILESYQGQGLGKWLIECILACPKLQGLRNILLATSDAHELYRKFGFTELARPEKYMQKSFEQVWFQPE